MILDSQLCCIVNYKTTEESFEAYHHTKSVHSCITLIEYQLHGNGIHVQMHREAVIYDDQWWLVSFHHHHQCAKLNWNLKTKRHSQWSWFKEKYGKNYAFSVLEMFRSSQALWNMLRAVFLGFTEQRFNCVPNILKLFRKTNFRQTWPRGFRIKRTI